MRHKYKHEQEKNHYDIVLCNKRIEILQMVDTVVKRTRGLSPREVDV